MTTVITKPDRRKGFRLVKDISVDTFDKCDTDAQRRILFEGVKGIHVLLDKKEDQLASQVETCDERFKKVENNQTKWKIAIGSVAGVGVVIGWFVGAFDKIKGWIN